MVKFKATINNKNFIGLGLSETNIYKLREGLPIHVDGKEIGIDHDIGIFYGKNEKELYEMVKPYLGKNTKIIPK